MKWTPAAMQRGCLADASLREKPGDVGEGLEFDRVSRRIKEKHRGLLAWLALEADVGLDDEVGTLLAQPVSKRIPIGHRQDKTEVAHRNPVPIDRVSQSDACLFGGEVGNDLMTIEVEVDPVLGTASFWAAEQLPIELACQREVMHREGDMEW